MVEADTKTLRVLVIRSGEGGQGPRPEWLAEGCELTLVASFEEALRRSKEESFDMVVGTPGDCRALESPSVLPQAAVILETITQGICIADRKGCLVWANPKLLSFSEETRRRVCRLCAETFSWATSGQGQQSAHLRGRRFSFTTADQEYIEVTATPVIDLNHQVTQVAAVVWDATRARRTQEKLDAIDNAGRELVRLDAGQISQLNAHDRLGLLEQKIIRYTRELMHFDDFAVRVLDKRTNKLELVLASGMPLESQNLSLYASAEGNGICGYVAYAGRSYLCPDVTKDPRYLPGIPEARSSLTVPLRLHDQVIGVFNIESEQAAAFTEDDRQFAEIFARHVAVALHMLDLLVSERHTTTGQLGVDVMEQITGPLNDIMTLTANLTEDYIGHDELRRSLNQITDHAVVIRDTVKRMTSPQRGVLGGRAAARSTHRDPVLSDKLILVADDEEFIRETVRDVLAGSGCEVHMVADGAEAMARIERHDYDLVLSDIRMPHKNGYEVFAAAKSKNTGCPVILMTGFGYDPNHSIVRARREGLAAVLFKPFKVDQLLGEIRTALKSTAAT